MNNIIGKKKSQLDTPCLVLDKELLTKNIATLQQEVNQKHKSLRPHVKTHKCSEICKLQITAGAAGIAAAKVSEAMVLAKQGFKNTLITSPVVTELKIKNLITCLQQDPELTVIVDNLENAYALNAAAQEFNLHLRVLIDLDPGVGRTGIAPHHVLSFAKELQKFKHLTLAGIQCYAGNLQHISDYQQRRAASTLIMQKAGECMKQLLAAGLPCKILTGSGTGTYDIDLQIPEVTEVQPGSYTVMDHEYYSIGSENHPTHYDKYLPAMTLLTSIISVNHDTHVTCDAGWKALYATATKPKVLHPHGYAYDWGGFGDEHGKITAIDNIELPKLGDRLELMVAHCDPTINMFDVFYVVENDMVVDIWPIDMRGKSQ